MKSITMLLMQSLFSSVLKCYYYILHIKCHTFYQPPSVWLEAVYKFVDKSFNSFNIEVFKKNRTSTSLNSLGFLHLIPVHSCPAEWPHLSVLPCNYLCFTSWFILNYRISNLITPWITSLSFFQSQMVRFYKHFVQRLQ